MVVGIISDTHGMLRPEALHALRGSDYIIHAGDVGDPQILAELSRIAPLTAIRGNIDRDAWADRLHETEVLEIAGQSFYILHDRNQLDLNPEAAGFASVISGHSHKPNIEVMKDVLYFNPGSAGPRRFRLPITVGRITIDGDRLQPEIINLEV
ncbi:MAG: phosphodiesterase, family [Candidatus Angelobacter sp.]|nr:phosphodiesterase, family [Candidatus Angelobacter sp.]